MCPPISARSAWALMCRDPARRMSGPRRAQPAGGRDRRPRPRPRSGGTARETRRSSAAPVSSTFSTKPFSTVTRGRAAAVYVCGPSGIGKSALVRSFLGRLMARDDVVVLVGALLRARVRALQGARRSGRQPVALHGVASGPGGREHAAARRRRAAATVPGDAAGSGHRQGMSRAGAAHCRALPLRRLGVRGACASSSHALPSRRRLVISIDDLQWADLDGALLLEELLRPPDAPALLTVVSFRSEEVAGNPFLRKLLEGGDRGHVVAPSSRADARN